MLRDRIINSGAAIIESVRGRSLQILAAASNYIRCYQGGVLLGRSSAGEGMSEEITIGANLTLVGGVLSATGGGGGVNAITSATTSDGTAFLNLSGVELRTQNINAPPGSSNVVVIQNDNNSDASLSYPAPTGGIGTLCCSLNTDGTTDRLQFGSGGHYSSFSADSIVIGVLEKSRWRTAIECASATHTHGSLTDDGKIGTIAELPLITSTGGLVVAGAWGTTSGTFCQGDDARLSDQREPLSHGHVSADISDSQAIYPGGWVGRLQQLSATVEITGVIGSGSYGPAVPPVLVFTGIGAQGYPEFSGADGENTWQLVVDPVTVFWQLVHNGYDVGIPYQSVWLSADSNITPPATGYVAQGDAVGDPTVTLQAGLAHALHNSRISGAVSFASGADAAFRVALGATSTGNALFTAADAAAARTAIGATSTGLALITSANAAAAATATGGGTAGIAVFGATAHTGAGSTRKLMGLDTTDSPVFTSVGIGATGLSNGAGTSFVISPVAGTNLGISPTVFYTQHGGATVFGTTATTIYGASVEKSGIFGWSDFAGSHGSTRVKANISMLSDGVLQIGTNAKNFGGDVKLRSILPDRTDIAAGTTTSPTINKAAGSVNLAAAATSLVVTNSLVTTASRVLATVHGSDTTFKTARTTSAAGSFTIIPDSPPTAETNVSFFVLS